MAGVERLRGAIDLLIEAHRTSEIILAQIMEDEDKEGLTERLRRAMIVHDELTKALVNIQRRVGDGG